MLWSINTCQKGIFQKRYQVTISQAHFCAHVGHMFFEVDCYWGTGFLLDHRLKPG